MVPYRYDPKVFPNGRFFGNFCSIFWDKACGRGSGAKAVNTGPRLYRGGSRCPPKVRHAGALGARRNPAARSSKILRKVLVPGSISIKLRFTVYGTPPRVIFN